MTLRFSLLLIFCTTLANAVEIKISVADIPERIAKHNPDLAAVRLRVEEARGRLDGAGRWANPELGFEYKNDTRFRQGSILFSLDQKFPLTSRLKLEKEVSAKQIQLAEWEERDVARLLAAEAKMLAVQVVLLDRQRALRHAQIDLAAKLATFVQTRVVAGEISALDAAQARVDSQRLVLDLRKLENESVALLGQLKARLGIAPEDTIALSGELPPLEMPVVTSWENRTDFQRARMAETTAQSAVDLAKAREWEDISVGLILEGERTEDEPVGLDNTGYIGFRVSVPLPLWNRNEGEVREKNASLQRSRLETTALAMAISHESRNARAEMEACLKLAEETRTTLLPLVQEQTAQLEKAYADGQADMLAVLRAREQRLQLEAGLLDAERDFHLARIRHEASIGISQKK